MKPLAILLLLALCAPALVLRPVEGWSSTLKLWHAYRGDEKRGIEAAAKAFELSHPSVKLDLLAVPFDAMRDKLKAQIPMGQGPDIFIAGSDAIGTYADAGYILPLESWFSEARQAEWFPYARKAMEYLYPGALWAAPGAFKNVALFYDKALLQNPPRKMGELLAFAKRVTDPKAGQFGRHGFIYEAGNLYFHAMWVHAFGGRFFKPFGHDAGGNPLYLPQIWSDGFERAAKYVRDTLVGGGVCPASADRTLIMQLFNTHNAPFVACGQWFRGEIDRRIDYGVAPMPYIEDAGRPATPFLGVEGFYMSSCVRDQKTAAMAIEYLTCGAMGRVFSKVGKQTSANTLAWKYAELLNDPIAVAFLDASKQTVAVPNCPEMALAWDNGAGLSDILKGADIAATLRERQFALQAAIEKDRKLPGLFKKYMAPEKPFPAVTGETP